MSASCCVLRNAVRYNVCCENELVAKLTWTGIHACKSKINSVLRVMFGGGGIIFVKSPARKPDGFKYTNLETVRIPCRAQFTILYHPLF
jgi:hypothetical protein